MNNLPLSQEAISFEYILENVMLDLFEIDRQSALEKSDVIKIINELHDQQHLFIFRDGTVVATRRGLNHYE